MNTSLDRFPTIRAIFYAGFHPTEGPKVYNQVPSGAVVPAQDPSDQSSLPELLLDFNDVKNYVIPKAQLCNRLVSLSVGNYQICGYPVRIYSDQYERNFFAFNFVFVFDNAADIGLYYMSIRRMAKMFTALEEQSKFLSVTRPSAFIDNIVSQMYIDLNNYSECLIPLDNSNSVNIKLFPIFPPPSTPESFQVPISTVNLARLADDTSDPTMEKIIPHINGINSIRRIADLADADYNLTLQCIRHLIHYRCIIIIDLFQFSNIYAPTSDISLFVKDPNMFAECQAYVFSPPAKLAKMFSNVGNLSHSATGTSLATTHKSASPISQDSHANTSPTPISLSARSIATGNTNSSMISSGSSFSTLKFRGRLSALLPSQVTLFQLFKSLNQGQTLREWVNENSKLLTCIDVRRFISFGVIKGLIYRVASYPILDSSRTSRLHNSRRHHNSRFQHSYSKDLAPGGFKDSTPFQLHGPQRYSFGSDPREDMDRIVQKIVVQPEHFDYICTELRLSKAEVENLLKVRGDWTIVNA